MSLFHIQVDISCTGQVKWQQLCSYLLLEYSERERASIPRAALQDSQQQLRHCSHNKVRSIGLNLLNDMVCLDHTLKGLMACLLETQDTV